MAYDGLDRRGKGTSCPLHAGIVDDQRRIQDKLDTIIDRQSIYITDIQHLKDVVENVLKANVTEMKANVTEMKANVTEMKANVTEMKAKVELIEDHFEAFTWFRTWVTALRDNWFKKSIALAFYGGLGITIIWFISSFGKQAIINFLSK